MVNGRLYNCCPEYFILWHLKLISYPELSILRSVYIGFDDSDSLEFNIRCGGEHSLSVRLPSLISRAFERL